jgi:hypothetical protein
MIADPGPDHALITLYVLLSLTNYKLGQEVWGREGADMAIRIKYWSG